MSNFRLVYSARRRRIALQIAPDGVLEVLSSPGVGRDEAENLISRHREIVDRLIARHQRTVPEAVGEGTLCFYRGTPYPVRLTRRLVAFDGKFLLPAGTADAMQAALENLYRKLAAAYILPRAASLAASRGVQIRSCAISGARTRYGSCTAQGKCSFSWRLIQYPDDLIDYVICHELAHRLEMNHSPRFYRVLETFFPGSEAKRRQLAGFSDSHKLF